MITRKERFLTAVRCAQSDRVPMFDFLFQQPMYKTLIGHEPGVYNTEDAVACALALDHDAVWLPFGGFILSTCNILVDAIPPENALAMYRAAEKYGTYGQGGVSDAN